MNLVQATLFGDTITWHVDLPSKVKRKRDQTEMPMNQTTLNGKTFSQLKSENELRNIIVRSWHDLQLVKKLRRDDDAMLELMLAIERYGGRGLPWYLNPTNFLDLDDCPKITEYEIGSYWSGRELLPGTRKFIEDRLEWAEKKLSETLRAKTSEFSALKRKRMEWK